MNNDRAIDTVVLFTNQYPHDLISEIFLDYELPYLAAEFQKVILVPSYPTLPERRIDRVLPSNVTILNSHMRNAHIPLHPYFRSLARSELFREFLDCLTTRKCFPNGLSMLGFMAEALRTRDFVRKFIKENYEESFRTVFYTYWFGPQTLGIGLAKTEFPHIKLVSRAHGYDLYEERHDPPYIPFRSLSFEYIDKLFLISEHGMIYLGTRYPLFKNKLIVSKLGVPDPLFITPSSNDGIFRIVSCSNLVKVKRIHLLVMGLAEAGKLRPGQTFLWSHIGTGPLLEEIETLAKQVLPRNVHYRFLGLLPPGEVINYYRKNPVDVFINVSEWEGIPVSIMEAQSCGIPAIATGVGGTPEIVTIENGILLEKDPTPSEIAKAIISMIDNPLIAVKKRIRAKENWHQNYNAEVNFRKFAELLRSI